MGREAQCPCRLGLDAGEVKALLESHELLLRGAFKRRFSLAAVTGLRVEGEWLCFEAAGEAVALELGAKDAASWAQKMSTPPPTLAEKLGIGPGHRAWVFGEVQDLALSEALQGALASRSGEAEIGIAVVSSEPALNAAVAGHAGMPQSRYLWVVHPKGKGAGLTDADVRRVMREHGYVDSKSCAVSDVLTAARYGRR